MHSDIWLLGLAVASMVVFGLPAIRTRIAMPALVVYNEIPEADLSPVQKEFFGAYDKKLAALGYYPLCYYRIVNMKASNLARLYQSSSGSGICFAAAITTAAEAGRAPVTYLEFVQDFQDGTRLATRNAPVSSVFDRPPQDILQQCPSLREPEDLMRRHDDRVRRLGLLPVGTGDKDLIFKRANENYLRFCRHQVSRGLLRYDAGSLQYRATYLTGLNGIKNFLNPFADNFTWPRFLLAAAFGLGLPAAGTLYGGGSAAAALLCYALGGAAIGALFSGKAFIWAFLLGYAASLAWPSPAMAPLTLSCVMALSADLGRRLKAARQRVV